MICSLSGVLVQCCCSLTERSSFHARMMFFIRERSICSSRSRNSRVCLHVIKGHNKGVFIHMFFKRNLKNVYQTNLGTLINTSSAKKAST